MKNKKIITAIISLAMAATLSAFAFAGCAKEEHVFKWTVDKEATCTETGSRTGVCNLHGDVVTEIIPVNPDAHVYGDWDIVTAPTENAAGKAVKTCIKNSSHAKLEVELPALSEEDKYLSIEETKRPTSIEEGVKTYTFEHSAGNVKIDVTLPKRGKETLEDAVYIGWANADKIRSRSGKYRESALATAKVHNFSYEFGDNYTHVKDAGNNMEYWYSVDAEGKVFGVGQRGNEEPKVDYTATDKKMLGAEYMSGGGTFVTYGAEDALYQYYEISRIARINGTAVKYKEDGAWSNDGSYVGQFSFGYYENPHFCRYTIDFSLNSAGILQDLKIDTMLIRSYMIAEDEKGGKLFYEDGDIVYAEQYWSANELPESDGNHADSSDPVYERDGEDNIIYEGYKTDADGHTLYSKPMDLAEGEYYSVLEENPGYEIRRPKPYVPSGSSSERRYYSDGHSEVSIRTVEYNAPVVKREGDTVPVNKYPPEECYVESFDARYSGAVLGQNRVTIPSNTDVRISLENIQPASALLSYDPIEIYVRTSDGDRLVSQNESDNQYRVTGYCDTAGKQVSLKVLYAGDITIILRSRSGKSNKEINLTVSKGSPSELFAQAYSYDDNTGVENYAWRNVSNESGLTLYVGQSVLLRGSASDYEKPYVNTEVTGECLYAPDPSNPFDFQPNPNISFETVEKDGEQVIKAVCTAARTYGVTLRSKAGNATSNVKIEAVNPPSVGDLFKKDYTAHVTGLLLDSNPNGKPADLEIKFNFTSNYRNGTIVVNIDGSKMNFTYSYNAATKTLTSQRVANDGVLNGKTFDFEFGLNEAYKLTLTHTTPFGTTEKVVLSEATAEE